MRTTPDVITDLEPDEIFVFGSNKAGRHGAGAARDAYKLFGAKWGCGYGMTGSTFAIPTKDYDIVTMPLQEISSYVRSFLKEATVRHDLTFLVTPIGCGLAGYSPAQIAPMFRDYPPNVVLPSSFLPYVTPWENPPNVV